MPRAPLKRFLTEPGPRFAVLVTVGMVIVATPLALAWRGMDVELQTQAETRAGLQPLALTVRIQKALASHQPFAAAVLMGRSAQESERSQRQRVADTELASLTTALETRRLARALHETDQLRLDWSSLLQAIGARQMVPTASNLAHELLVEQTFVVGDLVVSDSRLQSRIGTTLGTTFGAAELALVTTLPRLAARLELELERRTSPSDTHALPPAWPRLARAAARDAAQAVQHLHGLHAGMGAGAEADVDTGVDPALPVALVSLQRSLAELGAGASTQAPPNAAQLETTVRTSRLAATLLLEHIDRDLARQSAALQLERHLLLLTLALVMLIGIWAATLAVPRDTQHGEAGVTPADGAQDGVAAASATSATAGGAESEAPTSELLDRLRRGAPHTPADAAPRDRFDQR